MQQPLTDLHQAQQLCCVPLAGKQDAFTLAVNASPPGPATHLPVSCGVYDVTLDANIGMLKDHTPGRQIDPSSQRGGGTQH
jgi:hypothetical protein